MSEVMVPLANGSFLALGVEQFREALERGREMVGVTAPAPAQKDDGGGLLTAEELAARTGIPAPWFLEAARQGRIQHYRIGRYRRFSLAEVAESSRFRERAK